MFLTALAGESWCAALPPSGLAAAAAAGAAAGLAAAAAAGAAAALAAAAAAGAAAVLAAAACGAAGLAAAAGGAAVAGAPDIAAAAAAVAAAAAEAPVGLVTGDAWACITGFPGGLLDEKLGSFAGGFPDEKLDRGDVSVRVPLGDVRSWWTSSSWCRCTSVWSLGTGCCTGSFQACLPDVPPEGDGRLSEVAGASGADAFTPVGLA